MPRGATVNGTCEPAWRSLTCTVIPCCANQAATTADLRGQVATLSAHMTRALQDKATQASWDQERQELLATLKKKEEMIAMLSNTFQNLIKKS